MKCLNINNPLVKVLVDKYGEVYTSKILDLYEEKVGSSVLPTLQAFEEFINNEPSSQERPTKKFNNDNLIKETINELDELVTAMNRPFDYELFDLLREDYTYYDLINNYKLIGDYYKQQLASNDEDYLYIMDKAKSTMSDLDKYFKVVKSLRQLNNSEELISLLQDPDNIDYVKMLLQQQLSDYQDITNDILDQEEYEQSDEYIDNSLQENTLNYPNLTPQWRKVRTTLDNYLFDYHIKPGVIPEDFKQALLELDDIDGEMLVRMIESSDEDNYKTAKEIIIGNVGYNPNPDIFIKEIDKDFLDGYRFQIENNSDTQEDIDEWNDRITNYKSIKNHLQEYFLTHKKWEYSGKFYDSFELYSIDKDSNYVMFDANEIHDNITPEQYEEAKLNKLQPIEPYNSNIQYQKRNQSLDTDEYIASTKTIKDLAIRMSERIGIDVEFITDENADYKGYFDKATNKAVINLAYATLDTPIHEILGHPIINAIEKENPSLYNNLLKELESGKGKEIYDKLGDINESIVELLGLMTAGKLDKLADGNLVSILKRVLKFIKNFVRDLLNLKEIEVSKLPENLTLNDLSNLFGYSNSKLILSNYEVVYTTPDNKEFNTYNEASKHINKDYIENVKNPPKDYTLDDLPAHIKTLDDVPNFAYIENNSIKVFDKYKELPYLSYGSLLYKIDNKFYNYKDTSTIVNGNYIPSSSIVEVTNDYLDTYPNNRDNSDNSYYKNTIRENLIISYNNQIEEKRKEILEKNNTDYNNLSFDKNNQFEVSKDIIEEWKKVNNIKYNPNEAYELGEYFYSIIGGYSKLDTNALLRNFFDYLENVENSGGEFIVSALSKSPISRTPKLEDNAVVRIFIVPSDNDVKWASNADVHSGSVWGLKNGASYTKYPNFNNVYSIEPIKSSVAESIISKDTVRNHNEFGIELKNGNFRFEYDDAVDISTKKLINSINEVLDSKYGVLKKPTLYKKTNADYIEKIVTDYDEILKYIKNKKYQYNSIVVDEPGVKSNYSTRYNSILKQLPITFDIDSADLDSYNDAIKYVIENGGLVLFKDYSDSLRNIIGKNSSWSIDETEITGEEYVKKFRFRNNSSNQAAVNKKIQKYNEIPKKRGRYLIQSEIRQKPKYFKESLKNEIDKFSKLFTDGEMLFNINVFPKYKDLEDVLKKPEEILTLLKNKDARFYYFLGDNIIPEVFRIIFKNAKTDYAEERLNVDVKIAFSDFSSHLTLSERLLKAFEKYKENVSHSQRFDRDSRFQTSPIEATTTFKDTIEQLSNRFGIPVFYDTTIKNHHYKDGRIFMNPDKFTPEAHWHEFSHPFIQSIQKFKPKLYEQLVTEINSTKYGQSLREEVSRLYSDKSKAIQDEEVIVELIARFASGRLVEKDIQANPTLWNKLIEFLKEIGRLIFGIKASQLAKEMNPAYSVSSNPIMVSELGNNLTIKDLANILKYGGLVKLNNETDIEIDNTLVQRNKFTARDLNGVYHNLGAYMNNTEVTDLNSSIAKFITILSNPNVKRFELAAYSGRGNEFLNIGQVRIQFKNDSIIKYAYTQDVGSQLVTNKADEIERVSSDDSKEFIRDTKYDDSYRYDEVFINASKDNIYKIILNEQTVYEEGQEELTPYEVYNNNKHSLHKLADLTGASILTDSGEVLYKPQFTREFESDVRDSKWLQSKEYKDIDFILKLLNGNFQVEMNIPEEYYDTFFNKQAERFGISKEELELYSQDPDTFAPVLYGLLYGEPDSYESRFTNDREDLQSVLNYLNDDISNFTPSKEDINKVQSRITYYDNLGIELNSNAESYFDNLKTDKDLFKAIQDIDSDYWKNKGIDSTTVYTIRVYNDAYESINNHYLSKLNYKEDDIALKDLIYNNNKDLAKLLIEGKINELPLQSIIPTESKPNSDYKVLTNVPSIVQAAVRTYIKENADNPYLNRDRVHNVNEQAITIGGSIAGIGLLGYSLGAISYLSMIPIAVASMGFLTIYNYVKGYYQRKKEIDNGIGEIINTPYLLTSHIDKVIDWYEDFVADSEDKAFESELQALKDYKQALLEDAKNKHIQELKANVDNAISDKQYITAKKEYNTQVNQDIDTKVPVTIEYRPTNIHNPNESLNKYLQSKGINTIKEAIQTGYKEYITLPTEYNVNDVIQIRLDNSDIVIKIISDSTPINTLSRQEWSSKEGLEPTMYNYANGKQYKIQYLYELDNSEKINLNYTNLTKEAKLVKLLNNFDNNGKC
jgi:hypothetical protein